MRIREDEVKQGSEIVFNGEKLILLEPAGEAIPRIEEEETITEDFMVAGVVRIPSELRSNPYVYYSWRWKVFLVDNTPFDTVSGFVTHRDIVFRSKDKFRDLFFPEDTRDSETDLNESDLNFF